ncbi:ATP-binding cassette domain-containing protein [Thermophilibacter provencensis]|uniref:ABC transporter ATP-binding protein n=1 Tax=Thermophilibacter provencensis TaxID=1852386 RepID=A0ABT7V1E0_9ACTN|nr:ABC transporter ATP-binding protein [Thermophilibacter provencensis]MDM8270417.1 ABC transporter ATP-binding protein [Thermophilibacter provencensis]
MIKKSTYPIVDISIRNVARSVGVAASTLLAAATSIVVGRVVDVLASGAPGVGTPLSLALVLAVASVAATVLLGEWVPTWLGVRRFLDSAVACARNILAAPQRAFARREKGHFVNVLMNSTDTYGTLLYAGASVRIPGAVLALVGTVAITALIDPLMAALIVVYAPVLWLALRLPTRSLAELERDILPVQDAWLGESKRIVENKRAVNAAGAEGYFSARYRDRSEAFLCTVTRYRFLELLISNLPALLSCALAAAMMGVAAWRCVLGAAGVGQVLVAYSLAQLVQAPLTAIAQRVAQVRGNIPHVERLREVAAAAAEPSGFEALSTMGSGDPAARVDGTLWATPARDEDGKRLWAGEFEVRPGELVVVKGANGSGKSRLLDFLRGLSDPADLDGQAALSLEALHAAYLTYPVPVFPGNLAYNLLGAAADPEAARVLDLGDLTERAITDQPLNLSLGERQKLGLLRALSRPEPVVLLDEPLANLDAGVRARLCDHLAGLRGRKTVVAIMHSGELDAAADRIYEVRDGRLSRVK